MDNSTTPALAGPLLQITQLELVTPTTVAGTLYGIAFTLFCLYTHALAPRLRQGDTTRQAEFMLTYTIVIMLCGLYYLVANAWVSQDAYIKHSDHPGGPYSYILSTFVTIPVIPIGITCQMIVDVLTSAIQIWRVWVVWGCTRYALFATVPLVGCLFTLTGLRLRTIVLGATVSVAEVVSQDTVTQQVQLAMQGTITILCTLLISLYLIFKQRQQKKLIGKTHGYTGYANIVAMIVESYALESAWFLASIVFLNQIAGAFFAESRIYIEVIASLLVQYRVGRGKAYEAQRERRNISSLHWNHSNRATTQFGETGDIQAGSRVPAVPEAASAPPVSSMV